MKLFLASVLIILVIALFFFFLSELNSGEKIESIEERQANIDSLWRTTVYEMLQESLWLERDAYDTGHYLMVPMHASFKSKDESRINQFHKFFERFIESYKQDNFSSLNALTRLHFLYLTSQYLVLNEIYDEKNRQELAGLMNVVIDEFENIWKSPVLSWEDCGAPSAQDMALRIEWKLQTKSTPYSYCRAITDHELFSFAIAADIQFVLKEPLQGFIGEILDMNYRVFNSEVVFLDVESGKWLFQPGVWADHRDYIYSGWTEIGPNLVENPISTIASDTSHFHRFPLWLISFQRGFDSQEKKTEADYFKKLQHGLSKQFLEEVLVAPDDKFPNYRMNNFMDGYNGIYRYNYITAGEGKGYGPYDLSAALFTGWWSFLPNEKIQDIYCHISSRFPLSEEEIRVYLGPDSTRDRHPLVEGRAKYEKGLLELISKLICET